MPGNPLHSPCSMSASVGKADGSRSVEISISPGRDYAGLVELLSQLSRVPDGLGETVLTEEEAEQIRALGFRATRGEWLVPVLPHDLVRGDGLLEPLSDAWAEDPDPRRLLPDQLENTPSEIDQEESVEPDRIWSEDEVRILQALQRGGLWVKRRRLQKNLWRLGARRFNEAIASLQARDVLELNGSMVWLRVTEASANLQIHSQNSLGERCAISTSGGVR